ncbi:MAG: helix-turn-helix domain-containing protein [Streptosporangiales bacterium]|nr:helix-turn-helix domain-containing protein [Streptosporangiales bacterium]
MRDIFGPAADSLARAVLEAPTDERRIDLVQGFLRQRLPSTRDPGYDLLIRVVATMLDDRTITRVDQVADRYRMSPRTLQRLFHRYVGVGPKWMIRRYRLHDGAELLASGTVTDPAAMAVELGWFDQTHFTRDFTALIGVAPVEYATACASTGDREPMVLVGT